MIVKGAGAAGGPVTSTSVKSLCSGAGDGNNRSRKQTIMTTFASFPKELNFIP